MTPAGRRDAGGEVKRDTEVRLIHFARMVIDEFFGPFGCGDIDGGWIQEQLIDHKLVRNPKRAVKGCDSCDENGPADCYHPIPCVAFPVPRRSPGETREEK
jgi:hypothetical protein